MACIVSHKTDNDSMKEKSRGNVKNRSTQNLQHETPKYLSKLCADVSLLCRDIRAAFGCRHYSQVTTVQKFYLCKVQNIMFLCCLNSFHPINDPVTPIGFLDKLSLFMGVHEQSAVVVMDLGKCPTIAPLPRSKDSKMIRS